MEEDEYDSRSQIGQLIQKMQKLCKKPQIDDQLGSALEVFQEKVTRQKAYLSNGIFNINFAEAALFIQSCAELYGKKIDLLWDELLEFHTRLIEYDCQHEQEKGKKVNKEVIQQLEERRNRYKRKKKFKLILAQGDTNYLEDYLFEKSSAQNEIETFEADEDSYRNWRKLEYESSLITRIPKAVYKQQTMMYRMKNYYILKSEDFDIYDPEDGEFNTKYSRIPGWHFIEHIFEYNTKGLLPDRDNIIATLRLCCYLRAQFMRDNKIPFNAPYSQYKREYLKFKRKFFEEEAKKWQNMPLDTMADLHRQLEYLAKMEREANGEKNTKTWVDIPPFPKKICDIVDCSDCSDDSKSTIITISDSLDKEYDDVLKDISKCDAYVSLEKLSNEIIDPKLRQDSGFFELEDQEEKDTSMCENAMETDEVNKTAQTCNEAHETEEGDKSNESNLETSKESEITADGDKSNATFEVTTEAEGGKENTEVESTDKNNTDETNQGISNSDEANENTSTTPETLNSETDISPTEKTIHETTENMNVTEVILENGINDLAADKENTNLENDDDDFDVRSVISDHDYCRSPDQPNVLKENNNVMNTKKSNNTDDVMVPMSTKSRITPRAVRMKVFKENKPKDLMGPPTKRRKLSQKQIEKLMASKICPVKEMKFEKFFSMNYQPQLGEGDICEVNYESDGEVVQESEPTPELPIQPEPTVQPQSSEHDNDDLRSIISDHSYCQLPDVPNDDNQTEFPNDTQTEALNDDQPTINDSGFIDGNQTSTNIDSLEEEDLDAEELALSCRVRSTRPPRGPVDPEHMEEYERLLAEVRASRKEWEEEMKIRPGEIATQEQKREQERLESRERVEQWKETITPILKNLQEKDFDIHEYGGKIMEGMEIDETKPFKHIVDGKSSAEVVRYFIASLQLANTCNIDICGAQSGKLSNDTFEVKLLKKDRYHEHLAEFQAPSEETFPERIKRMREAQEEEESERRNEMTRPLHKRQRIDKIRNKRRAVVSSSDDDDDNDNFEPHTSIISKHTNSRRQKEQPRRKYERVNKTSNKRRRFVVSSSDDDKDDSYEPHTSVTYSNASKNQQCYRPKRSTTITPNPAKGKNIAVRISPVESTQNVDLNTPSTSSTYWYGSSSHRPLQLSPSDDENFETDLAAMQESNPQIQICSTPLASRSSKSPEPVSSSVRLLF